MRKILSLLFILICSYTFAQPVVNRAGAANTVADANLFALRSFRPPVYADTTAANNAYPTLDSAGKVFYSYNDKAIWFRQHSPQKWVKLADQNLVNNITGCYGLLNGGIVTWSGVGLVMNVTASYYVINCNYYNADGSLSVTLGAANPTNPRIDVIAVDTAENIVVIAGTPGVNPVKPQVNPTYQVELTEVYIPAAATTPQSYTYKTVYNENVEWTSGSVLTSGSVNFNSTTFPSVGTKNLRVASGTVGNVYWDTTAAYLTSSYQSLSLRLSFASSPTNDVVPYIYLRDNGVQVTQPLTLDGFGYSSVTGINEYNVITIPMSAFTFTSGSTFDGVGLYFGGIGAIVDVDYVQLQTGTNGGGVIGNYLEGIRRLPGSTDVEGLKNGVWQYLFTDSTGGGSLLTFSGGLTESGGVVKLGGVLTNNTSITNPSGYEFNIHLNEDNDLQGLIGDTYGSFIGFANGSTLMYGASGSSSITLGNPIQIVSSGIGRNSTVSISRDSINIYPNLGNLKIDSLNYTLSTTGKKVMLRDTTTGLVQNIDPALIGGGSAIEVTQAIAVSLANSSSLSAGSTYKITGVQPTLYDDGTSSGTTIFLKAETTSLFEKKGFGLFYNPKYDHNITGFGVVDTSASYSVGDTVYWGQYVWVCNTGGMAVATDILNLDGNWTKLPYSSVRYNAVLDEIEYDFENDWIVSRREADANNIVSCSKGMGDYLANEVGLIYLSISVFMWGNAYNYNTSKGVGGNTVTDSYLECTNLYGGNIYSNTLSGSSIFSNTLSNSSIFSNTLSGSSISSNTLSNSYISSNTLSNSSIFSNTLSGSSIFSNTLNNSYISSNTLNNSSISYNTLSNSSIYVGLSYNLSGKEIKYITGEYGTINVDITSATVVFGDYPKTLFRLPDGTFKLRYYNNSGTLVVANVTD